MAKTNADMIDVNDLVDDVSQGEPGESVNQEADVSAALEEAGEVVLSAQSKMVQEALARSPEEVKARADAVIDLIDKASGGEIRRPIRDGSVVSADAASAPKGATIPRGVLDAAKRRVAAKGLTTASETTGERRTRDAAALTGLESEPQRASRRQAAREEAPRRVSAPAAAPKPAGRAPAAAPKAGAAKGGKVADTSIPKCLCCVGRPGRPVPELEYFCAQACGQKWAQQNGLPGADGAKKTVALAARERINADGGLTWNADTQTWDAKAAPAAIKKGGRAKKAR